MSSNLRLPPRTKDVYEDSDRFSTVSSDTYRTDETESSATTVWGPGTLSGRAIKSLGEASLRGVEKLMLRWRLAKINALLPGLGSGGSSAEKIYDDLLELSRLDFYDAKVRQKALKMIMIQIGSRETYQLLLCVVKWPREEIIIFLSEMMPCIPLLWHTDPTAASEADMKTRLELIAVYRSSQLPSEAHEVLPFLDLISRLAQEHESSCQAVIESGFLDTLAFVCDHCTFDEAPAVITAVQKAIGITLSCQRGWDVVRTPQRLQLVWPRINDKIPLNQTSLDMISRTPNARKQLWLVSPSSTIVERLCEIAVVLSMPELCFGCEKDLFDLCFDLLIFCDLHGNGTNFTELSMSYISQIIAIGGDIRTSLQHVLTLLPYHNKLDFFHRMIYPLSSSLYPQQQNFIKKSWPIIQMKIQSISSFISPWTSLMPVKRTRKLSSTQKSYHYSLQIVKIQGT
ncbi:hypothetical protein GYMLUDRAFT_568772 [Collybiopsis luxurians FD-317 M1]|uniref:Uncharacterized protein n=1 Tax=Collybiopsis luxurians FD-317 M1 TaxID=944289 RepID=A0A0D0CR49_9AGAR|nr:hypothetical protein GYMLUDRAFT_568772 [Collybiopsis luxurians FD-317 M1]